jgi:hypothetical protein
VLKLKEGKEATPIGSVIYRMRASDADGDALQFALLGQAANELLSVRPVPGNANEADLILIKELDREVSTILFTHFFPHTHTFNYKNYSLPRVKKNIRSL